MELSQIKTKVSIYSKSNKISIQKAWDVFFFESFLYRLSKSEYSQNFAIKGGFYLQSIVGIQMRSTMDIDLKYIGNRLNENDENKKYPPAMLDKGINYPTSKNIKYSEEFYSKCINR